MGLDTWTFTFAILGNVISFMVFLAPMRTFIRIYKKKSTEGFQSVPYVVSMFSALLWIFYAVLKPTDSTVILAINVLGLFIQTVYLVTFLIYADRKAKEFAIAQFLALNVGGFGAIILIILLLFHETKTRVHTLGWICVAFSVAVFAAPLSIMRRVVKTKSVEFMPFLLSLFLTLSAVTWFFYGLLIKDFFVAMPNVLGFTFGVAQMVLYMCYRNSTKRPAIIAVAADEKCPVVEVVEVVEVVVEDTEEMIKKVPVPEAAAAAT